MSKIIELPHHPKLGRHVQHDPRSLRYAAGVLPRSAITSKFWPRRVPIFDQGNLGSCTGNAAAGWVVTDNASRAGLTTVGGKPVDENYAVMLYSLATELDEFKGTYPPTDTGSSGLGAVKALQTVGQVASYTNAFSFDALASALQTGPAMIGINWYNSMFDTNPDGHIIFDLRSGLAGGHEIVVTQIDVTSAGVVDKVWIENSWGSSWGLQGRAWMTGAEWTILLSKDGDVVVPFVDVVIPPPPPTPPPPPPPPPPPSPPPPPIEALDFHITDPEVVFYTSRAITRSKMTNDEWATNCLQHYFRIK